MSPKFRLQRVALAAAALLFVLDASALTLGRVRGAALIGRPLDLSIPVTLDAEDGEGCASADLFQGDARFPPNRYTVRLEGSGASANVRITSSAAVEEPVVTVFLRVGCGQQATRRYVLLAELPPDAQGAPAPAALPAVPAQAAAAAAPSAAASSAAAAPTRRRGARAAAPADAAAAASAASAAAPAAAATPAAPSRGRASGKSAKAEAAAAKGSRLKLEPLDLSVERDPVLRGTQELTTQPGDSQARALAAALWQALNAQPEDILRNAQRMQQLESDVKSLRDAVQKNNQALGQMREQVEKARSERDLVTWALIGVVLAAVAGAIGWVVWRRRRGSGREWWRGDSVLDSEFARPETPAPSRPVPVQPSPDRTQPVTPQAVAAAAAASTGGPDSGVDLDLSFTESALDRLHTRPPAAAPKASRPSMLSDFQHSGGGMRMVKAEELFDIQQQADFFLSIGQHEQAIQVLEAHIHDHVETSALAWLDLLEVYHALGRKADYERVVADFRNHFNAQVPPFDAFGKDAGGGLENYSRALSRIVSLWPSPRAMQVIEESIFRKPGSPGADAFDLEAYRDLLLLYNVAKDIIQERESRGLGPDSQLPEVVPPSNFGVTSLQPLPVSRMDPLSPSLIPPASRNIGLDIDLDAMPEGSPAPLPPLDMTLDAPAPQPAPAEPKAAPAEAGGPHDGNLIDFNFDAESELPKPPADDEPTRQ